MSCRSGDILAVIDKLESSLGWWKAMKGGKLGYIPKVISTGLAKYPGVSFNRASVFWVLLFKSFFYSFLTRLQDFSKTQCFQLKIIV
jgi:hypothetical protein